MSESMLGRQKGPFNPESEKSLSPDGIRKAIRPRAPATQPCRHARSRCTETAEPRAVCGRARAIAWRASCAPRDDYRSALSLAGRPCLIIGVRECRHETGNIVRRASVEATSVVGDRARVRRLRRIRTVRISGRPAQPGAALAGACGQAASHPRIGGTGVPTPGLSEQASNYVSMTDIACSQCGEYFRPRRSTAQYCSPTCRKASARFRAVSVPQTQKPGLGPAAIVPDCRWLGMYRLVLPDGSLSEMVNLTRARDALSFRLETKRIR